MNDTDLDTWVEIAVVTRAHGLHGDVRLFVHNEHSELLERDLRVRIMRERTVLRESSILAARHVRKNEWVVRLRETSTVEQAEALRQCVLQVRREDLPAIDDSDEFYVADALGCAVQTASGKAIGTVTQVLSYPSVDALEVQGERGTWEIPCVDGIVLSMDLEARVIVVDETSLDDFAQAT